MNNKLKCATESLKKNIERVPSHFLSYSYENLNEKQSPDKWSKLNGSVT